MQKYGLLQNIFSNRFQPSLPAKHRYALMYSLLSAKRWDSSDGRYIVTKGRLLLISANLIRHQQGAVGS
jgi:hypothetical protein